jgi:putative thioredoxin
MPASSHDRPAITNPVTERPTEPTPPPNPYVLEATADNFQEVVLANSRRGPVLVNFWSRRAGPCLRLYPILDRLSRGFGGGFLLANLDTDRHGRFARGLGITSVPTLKLYRDEAVVETVHGFDNEAALRRMLSRHAATPADMALKKALDALRAGHRDMALQRLAEAAVAHPEDLRIPLTLAKLLVQQGELEQAQRLLATMPAPLREAPEAEDLAAHVDLLLGARAAAGPARAADPRERRFLEAARDLVEADDLEGAARILAGIVETDPGWADGRARRALRALLRMLPGDHPLRGELRVRLPALRL